MASVSSSPAAMAKRRTRRMGRTLSMAAMVAVVGGLAWWGWAKLHPADDPASKMLTATVTRGDLLETVSATGSVTAQTGAEVHIGSQITGTIKRLYADVGSYVHAGQIIAELNLPDIQAQVNQAQANLDSSRTKLLQQESGVGMERTQTSSAIQQAQANVHSLEARLAAAEAAARVQTNQTPTDIKRAQTAIAVAQAALSTAQSNLKQVQASANLQINTAQSQLRSAQATEANAAADLKRQKDLLARGFVAPSIVDQATAAEAVASANVSSAQQNVELVKEKVAADQQSAQDAVTQAQQNVAAAQAALVAAQGEVYQDKAKLADVEDTRAQLNQAKATLQAALGNKAQDVLKQQDVLQAQEAVSQSTAQLAYNRAQFDKTLIRSPISGTVLQLASQQGETLAAGLSAPTLIIVCDLTRLQVDAFVDETDIGKVKLGQEADVTVDAFPKHVFKGHVTKIASGSTIQSGVITYDVTVAIDDKRHQLKPDMTADVILQTGKRSNVLLVPAEAVKLGTRGATINVLTRKDGKVSVDPRKVKTGGSDGTNTEIRDGVKEGETVVLAGGDNTSKPQMGGSPFGPGGGRGGGGGGRGGGR